MDLPKTRISAMQHGSVVRLENGLTGVYDKNTKTLICYEGSTGNGDFLKDVKDDDCFSIIRTPKHNESGTKKRIHETVQANQRRPHPRD